MDLEARSGGVRVYAFIHNGNGGSVVKWTGMCRYALQKVPLTNGMQCCALVPVFANSRLGLSSLLMTKLMHEMEVLVCLMVETEASLRQISIRL